MNPEMKFAELSPLAKTFAVVLLVLGAVVVAGLIGAALWGVGWVWQQAIEVWS